MAFYSQPPFGHGGPPSRATLLLQLPDEAPKGVAEDSGDQTYIGGENRCDLVDFIYRVVLLHRSEVRIVFVAFSPRKSLCHTCC